MKFDCKYDAMLEIEKIVRHPRNNNMHPIEQIEAFQRIISKKGVWRIPLIISKKSGFLVAGHLRLTVAESMGLERLPVVYQDFESEADEYQFLTFDNEIARWAKLDRHEVHLALEEIEGLELDDLGIQGFEIQEIKQVEGEDDAPEIDETKTISTLGDIWILGNHRVMCGDSTVITHVEKLMDGQKADMVFTDPPYGMDYSGRGKDTSNKIKGDTGNVARFYDVLHYAPEVYLWGRPQNWDDLPKEPRATIVWKKNNFGMGKGYRSQYELCFYYGAFLGSDSNVWEVNKDVKYQHPTQKPVALCERAIKNSKPHNVLDLFLGSGSTLIACEKTNRKCYGMELDPKYVDVIIKRWQDFTGKEAVYINGKKFNEYL